MRTTISALVLVAACGGGDNGKKDAAIRDTGGATADAPPLATCTPRNGNTISLRKIGELPGTGAPMLVTSPVGDGRLFVVEREGRIHVFENETRKADAFLSITGVDGFVAGGEQGLLGMAFHPNYASNRQFFIYYTTGNANVVARYYGSETDINKADPTGEIVLSIPDFAGNHNGGMIEFGADGNLYIATGDGGGGGDPCRNGQQLLRNGMSCPGAGGTTREPLLGKILRIDVDAPANGKNYGIPADNPYANGVAGEPEIFISGLRNPWRWSFDRQTGDMYIGDVGQEVWEEVTVLTPTEQSGANLGWNLCEGQSTYPPGGACTNAAFKNPQFVRDQQNDNWMSVIGGQVYRGTCFPDLVGSYFFTDYVSRELMRGTFANNQLNATNVGTVDGSPTSLHADARGELYLTTEGGDIFQLEAAP